MNKNGKFNFHNYQQQTNYIPNNNISNTNNIIPKNEIIITKINNNNPSNMYNNNINISDKNNVNQIFNQNTDIPQNQFNTINTSNYPNKNSYINNINNNYPIPNISNNTNRTIMQQMKPASINQDNNNYNYNYQQNIPSNNFNSINNLNYGYNRVKKISESKELKIRKQEEYRKELDEQMRYELERKEKERQIKYGGGINGLGSLNIINKNNNIKDYAKAQINSSTNNNINNTYNNINNNYNNLNNNKDVNIPELNNNTITRPSINKDEKEKLRRKQMEYNEILRQQVEERNKMKEIAKQREKEEEIKFEEKIKRQIIENQKRAEMIKNNEFKNNKYAHNLESPENFMANPMSTMPIPQMNLQGPNNQINRTNLNPSYTAFAGFYGNNSENNIINNQNNINLINNTNQKKYNNIDRKTDSIQNSINPNTQNVNVNNNNYPNNYFNITPTSNGNTNTNNLYNIQNSLHNYGQRPTPSQTTTAFANTSKTNSFNNNIRPISQQSQRKIRNDTWRIEELYMNFVQEQLKIINEYELEINKYQNMKKDNFETIKDLMIIKNQALDKIQEAQNKFKDTVGVYPMDNNFNNRVTNLMDMMLEKKINDIQRENKLEILANNYNKQKKNNGKFNNNINENGIQSNGNNNNNDEFIPISESQINRNIIGCGYKSKYEELKISMMNGNEASQELRTSMSLAGISKFVKQNKLNEKNDNMNEQDNNYTNGVDNNNYQNMYCNINNGQSNLYTTWNSEKFPGDEQNNINNNINNPPLNTNEKLNNINKNNINKQEIIDTTVEKHIQTQMHLNSNPNNKKLNHNRNNSKGILNDSQLPSKIVGNDKGLFNHANDEISGSNISMQESNSNINNYINGSDLNIEHPFNSPSPTLKIQQISENNTLEQKNGNNMKLGKNVKNMKLTKEEKDKSLLLVGDNIIKNNLTHGGYSQREKENKEKSYLIGNITTLNNNINDNTINNTNQYISANNTFTNMNTNTNNNMNKSQESENNFNKENENISLGATVPSKKNYLLGENNETEEDIVRGFGQSGMNSMLNDENTSNFNHSNINNNSGINANIIGNKTTFGKKKGIVNNNKEIQQIKEAEEKEEEENYAYDFTLDNKTLKKLEEEEKTQNSKKINLDDYKAIKESQKIQTQLNFFEDSVLENINISKSKAKGRVIKSYNMLGNKNKNIIKNLVNDLGSNDNDNNNINNSNSKKSNNTNTNTNVKRPQSPKHNRNTNNGKNSDDINNVNNNESSQNNRNNMSNYNDNSSLTNLGNDSYGDHIINDLNKYRKMFLEESSMD